MPADQALLHNWFYGNYAVRVSAAVFFAFVFCSIPLGNIIRWLFTGLDSRLERSANALVPVLNALKGFIATVVAFHGGGESVGLAAASAGVIGHAYSPWVRGRGGNGIDVLVGMLLAFSFPTALLVLVFWAAAAAPTRSAMMGTLSACALLFFPLWFFGGPAAAAFGIFAGTAIALRLRMPDQASQTI
jgi:glycerol-3-phosphate acyltransferase PlsY